MWDGFARKRREMVLHVLGGFKKALRGFSVEAPYSGFFSGLFSSDSGGLPGCNSDFRARI